MPDNRKYIIRGEGILYFEYDFWLEAVAPFVPGNGDIFFKYVYCGTGIEQKATSNKK